MDIKIGYLLGSENFDFLTSTGYIKWFHTPSWIQLKVHSIQIYENTVSIHPKMTMQAWE